MQMTTKTVYDYPHMLDLQRIAGKTFAKKNMNKKRTMGMIWGVVMLVMDAMMAIRGNQPMWTALFAIPGILLLGYGLFFYQITAHTTCKAMGSTLQSNEFEFEDEVVAAWRGDECTEYPYTECTQLLETELAFYMLLASGGGLILDKKNLKGGTEAELISFLEEKTGKTMTWMGNKAK